MTFHVDLYGVFTIPALVEGTVFRAKSVLTPAFRTEYWKRALIGMARTNHADSNMSKERFSLAYIRAVAAHAGYYADEPQVDRSSIDGVLRADFGRGPRIEFQAKATSQDIQREDHLAFSLPIGNYRDLSQDAMVPRILIVVHMPQERTQWLHQTSHELCLRHCAYWFSLKGLPPVPNTTSVTVHIPVINIFDREQLSDLMEKVERGELV